MNTTASDRLVREWKQRANPLKRAMVTVKRTFTATAEQIFPLLCPTAEYDWIPTWSCELLHSDSGLAEYDCVFRTRFFGEEETWLCTKYEPPHAIDYARTSGSLAGKMEIRLAGNGNGTVTGRWVLRASALTKAGNAAVARLHLADRHLAPVLDGLAHYLGTGETVAGH